MAGFLNRRYVFGATLSFLSPKSSTPIILVIHFWLRYLSFARLWLASLCWSASLPLCVIWTPTSFFFLFLYANEPRLPYPVLTLLYSEPQCPFFFVKRHPRFRLFLKNHYDQNIRYIFLSSSWKNYTDIIVLKLCIYPKECQRPRISRDSIT